MYIEKDVDKDQNVGSFPPNFIHSLDAANLHLFLESLRKVSKINQIATIHDSVGTTLNNLTLTKKLFKKSFITLYKENIDNILLDFLKRNKIYNFKNATVIKNWTTKRNHFDWEDIYKNEKFIKF